MSGKQPTYHRLIAKLKAIGPYLREGECEQDLFLFDCLSVCVDDKKSPECREFWGWWMELEKQEQKFVACYHHGKYNAEGEWIEESLPESAEQEVLRTQQAFQTKVETLLQEQFGMTVDLHEDSEIIA
ncbi:curlin genes transcriptional activator [Vibrio ishigakensis]|uniref:Sigma factor-binding protein Crl n=1 Tax=Vibrio ishigakensis TaxID=1481914 RepID=A0A0B8P569_9VIBR|nr:sigma factor-binding protein Crl [Vibrio ishigakensis]GAM55770.1 curlin genes transcriptional activator [Vibrio ishigakensis]GAM61915.1 curlin genes transcriptional activator [Vibrio ishigakensis]GAM69190.1 curlin genes transcriptional activator [Vibrio sp. JCM 19236]